MLPYYDIKIAKQDYQERLQAAETERQWLAWRRRQPSVRQQFLAAIQAWVGTHAPAPSRPHGKTARNA